MLLIHKVLKNIKVEGIVVAKVFAELCLADHITATPIHKLLMCWCISVGSRMVCSRVDVRVLVCW